MGSLGKLKLITLFSQQGWLNIAREDHDVVTLAAKISQLCNLFAIKQALFRFSNILVSFKMYAIIPVYRLFFLF